MTHEASRTKFETGVKAPTILSDIYINPSASVSTSTREPPPSVSTPSQIRSFHTSLPGFNTTLLHDCPQLARPLGVAKVLIKAESSRLGLPAFKILGASWGVYKALSEYYGLEDDVGVTGFEGLRGHIQKLYGDSGGHASDAGTAQVKRKPKPVPFAATDGNHGRAVARIANLLGLSARIYVPSGMYESTKLLIASEEARVVTVQGDYDCAVAKCWADCQGLAVGEKGDEDGYGESVGVMVQDNAFPGYDIVPRWIVEGYATLLSEVEEQFTQLLEMEGEQGDQHITHIVTPIGVGSLGHAVVYWAKSAARRNVKVITVEPETAACLHKSLKAGENTTIETVDTIMSGMCCGTVSPVSWPVLKDGVDASVVVDDWTCHETVEELRGLGIDAGPCGAGCLAGLRRVMSNERVRAALGLGRDSVVVVLSTEGTREYPVPERQSADIDGL